MTVINRIAHFQNRHDEAANVELAQELAAKKDKAGIAEIAGYLNERNADIQGDCLKVLYEVGALNPGLIAPYAGDFLKLLDSRHNRLVWQAMTALASIAEVKADVLYAHRAAIQTAMEAGSVITQDNGVQALARVAATSDARRRGLLPFLLQHLQTCRPKDVPQHSEKMLVAVNAAARDEFVKVLENRMPEFSSAQASRVKKVIKAAGKL